VLLVFYEVERRRDTSNMIRQAQTPSILLVWWGNQQEVKRSEMHSLCMKILRI